MEPVSCIRRSKSDSISSFSSFSSFSSILSGKEEGPLLPAPVYQKPKIRVREVLSHCLYRRVIIWSLTLLTLLFIGVCTSGVHTRHGRVLDLVDFGKSGHSTGTAEGAAQAEGTERSDHDDNDEKTPHWLKFTQ